MPIPVNRSQLDREEVDGNRTLTNRPTKVLSAGSHSVPWAFSAGVGEGQPSRFRMALEDPDPDPLRTLVGRALKHENHRGSPMQEIQRRMGRV